MLRSVSKSPKLIAPERLLRAITHIHPHPHEPHPICEHREASYFQAARMARQMKHL
jgi:hypothetical protein